MSRAVLLVADAGERIGLGHVARLSAIAWALRCRGIEVSCNAYGCSERFELDGLEWQPTDGSELTDTRGAGIVLDSYTLPPDLFASAADSNLLFVVSDDDATTEYATLRISAHEPESRDRDRRHLSGFRYACLRTPFWGVSAGRTLAPKVSKVLITTGSMDLGSMTAELVSVAKRQLPDAELTVVVGPFAQSMGISDVRELPAPPCLLQPLLETDLVITAGGQTALEAAATGTPALALPIVENQRRQTARLSELGAVVMVEPADNEQLRSAIETLATSDTRRRELSVRGQATIDGYGALRVAFEIERVLSRSPIGVTG